ncbi:hypothetical protein [Halomontanus rarus]
MRSAPVDSSGIDLVATDPFDPVRLVTTGRTGDRRHSQGNA